MKDAARRAVFQYGFSPTASIEDNKAVYERVRDGFHYKVGFHSNLQDFELLLMHIYMSRMSRNSEVTAKIRL